MFRSIFKLGIAALAFLPCQASAQLTRQPNSTLNLPSEPPSSTYTTTNALPGITFSAPMCTTYPVGEANRLYVVERAGRVQRVANLSTTPSRTLFMDLAAYLTAQGTPIPAVNGTPTDEDGLLSMVFHPNYNQNGYFFLYYTVMVNGQRHQRLARFQAIGTPGNYLTATAADPATQTPLLSIYDENGTHTGGDLAFGADGYLYISLGDEGNGGDQYDNARYINKDFWGQMLRLDVDNKPANLDPNPHTQAASTTFPSAIHAGTYRVPADNPFIGATSWHGLTIAPNTVRWHQKRIFAKTGTPGRTALILMFNRALQLLGA